MLEDKLIYVVLLDFSKAFDRVAHMHIGVGAALAGQAMA